MYIKSYDAYLDRFRSIFHFKIPLATIYARISTYRTYLRPPIIRKLVLDINIVYHFHFEKINFEIALFLCMTSKQEPRPRPRLHLIIADDLQL